MLSAARGCSAEERGISFRVLDLPHLGAVSDAADLEKRTRISKMTEVELDAWISDRSLQPCRVGMSRAERELLVMRVRKLPCDAEAAACAVDAFVADAALESVAEAAITDEITACADSQQRYDTTLRHLDGLLTMGKLVWLDGLSKSELNARWGVIAGPRTRDGTEARYPVELTDDGPGTRCIAVRPTNLRPGRPGQAYDTSDPSLHVD